MKITRDYSIYRTTVYKPYKYDPRKYKPRKKRERRKYTFWQKAIITTCDLLEGLKPSAFVELLRDMGFKAPKEYFKEKKVTVSNVLLYVLKMLLLVLASPFTILFYIIMYPWIAFLALGMKYYHGVD